jgi:hypothetical protein
VEETLSGRCYLPNEWKELSASSVAGEALRTAFGRFWVAQGEELPECLRASLFAEHAHDFRYYEIVERTLSEQFFQRYLVLENEATGEVTAQPFFIVEQDLLAGSTRCLRDWIARARHVFPRALLLRTLMVGCAAAEGCLADTRGWAVRALHEALEIYSRQARVSLVVLKDFPVPFRDSLTLFTNNGYRRIASMPAAIVELDFDSFDDFMQRKLSRSFRKNLRRKFRKLEGRPPIALEVVRQIDSGVAEEAFQLYLQTFARSRFQFERLTKSYFQAVGERMPERARYFLWRQEGRLVAFSLILVHADVLYDLILGMQYPLALELHLYFVTWRDMVQWAVEQGVKTYRSGPLNYDPKLHFRMHLDPLDLYVRHTSGLVNPVLHRLLPFLEPTRYDSVLRRFRDL